MKKLLISGEFGEGCRLMAPATVARGRNVKAGKRVVVMNNLLFFLKIENNVEK